MSAEIGILIFAKDPVVREGLKRIIEGERDLQCAGLAQDFCEVERLLKEVNADVILVYGYDCGESSSDAIKVVRDTYQDKAILILASSHSSSILNECLKLGIDALLSQDIPIDQMLSVIRICALRYTVISPGLVKNYYGDGSLKSHRGSNLTKLHFREIQVIKLAAKGYSNKEIGQQLSISVNTVNTHFINIFRKLKVESRTEAVLLALRQELITLDETA